MRHLFTTRPPTFSYFLKHHRYARPLRWTLGSALGLTSAYYLDSEFNAKTFQRNFRTLFNGAALTLDYKFRFKPGADIDSIHQRCAERILKTCQDNGGLYIKFGQSIASMNHILPPQYNEVLKPLFMNAPVIPFDEVVRTFQEEFKCHPDAVFTDFERIPVASASIAQVHRAKLSDGTPVAVKVQKDYIRKQLFWDMLIYRFVLRAFEFAFDLPLFWSADYTERHLRQEVNFYQEAQNAERAAADFAQDAYLKESIYVPKVYWQFTNSRILTSEWVDGIALTEPEKLKQAGFGLADIMEKVVAAFAHQIFHSGFVHADPHPGNVLVRRKPGTAKTQVVILDHGLYVEESDSFRKQYCMFWKALFLMDKSTLNQICKDWGIQDVNMFASATLQRPYHPSKAVHLGTQALSMDDIYRMQMVTKERIAQFLSDTSKIPLELIFVGRNLNLVRSNNKALGSPVNRINIMATWAVRGLGSDWSHWSSSMGKNGEKAEREGWPERVRRRAVPAFNYWLFHLQLLLISVSFRVTRAWQRVKEWATGRQQSGFEDVLDRQMVTAVKEKFGVTINVDTFSG